MKISDLKAFGIQLKHHLAAEQELFDAGLVDQPFRPEPEVAKYAGTIKVSTKTPFQPRRRVNNIPDFEFHPIRKGLEGSSDFTITIQEGAPKQPDFQIEPRRRIEPLDGMDLNPRRRV